MGFQTCSTHGLRYEDYGECSQCMTERLQEEAMRRQEELLREQVELMRQRAASDRQHAVAPTESAGDTITKDNLSKDLLKSVLDAAMFESSYDADGDIVVSEQVRCFVLPSKEKGTIKLMTGYLFKQDVPNVARLEAVNKINVEYVLVRASVAGDVLYMDHDILLNNGLSKRSFALTVKRFCSIPAAAVGEHAAALVQ